MDGHACVSPCMVTRVRRVMVESEQKNVPTVSIPAIVSSPRRHKNGGVTLSTMCILLLICTLMLPTHSMAAGPRLLSSEYEVRSLKLGTVGHASSGSGFELSWRSYELLSLDLVFDQPLYISSAASIEAASGGTGSTSRVKPLSPHSTNHTVLPQLDGSIVLDCGLDAAKDVFILSVWPDGRLIERNDTTATDESPQPLHTSFWTSPSPLLLPTFSPRNELKDQLRELFDPASDARARKSSTLLASQGGRAAKAIVQTAGKPNILSLFVVIGWEEASNTADGQGKETYLSLDRTDPLHPASMCSIRYKSVKERKEEIVKRIKLEMLEAEESDSPSNEITTPEQQDLLLSSLSGLTNFKGHEFQLSAPSPLQPKKHLAESFRSAFLPPRTLIRVEEGLEKELGEEDLLGELELDAKEGKYEKLYAHSPLESDSAVVTQAQPKHTLHPDASALLLDVLDDPFNNIMLDLGAASQFVTLILRPICHGVMKPATKGTTDLLLDDIMTELGNNMFYSVVDEVGPDLNIMLGLTVQAAVSNILQDALTYAITKSLTQAITANVSPYVIDRLIKILPGPLHTIIQAILEKKIPDRLERTMPVILSRVLSVTLTHSLTRSIPHVVVPSVSHSLGLGHAGSFSRPKAYYEVCMQCYLQSIGRIPPVRMSPPDLNPDGYDSGIGSGGQKAGSECGACPTSTYSMYYGIYHAAYFTDYYSEYYAEYYSQAMQQTDAAVYSDDGAAHGTQQS